MSMNSMSPCASPSFPRKSKKSAWFNSKGTNTPAKTNGTKEVLRIEYRQDGSTGWHLTVNETSGPKNILDYQLGDSVTIRTYVNEG